MLGPVQQCANAGSRTMNVGKPVSKKPCIPTAEVGTQTIPTAIPGLPVESRSHFIFWGLDKDKPSPLSINKNTVDHSFNDKKRKLEDADSNLPPNKRPALGDQDDQEFQNGLFGFLDNNEYPQDYLVIQEEEVTVTPIAYDGVVDVDIVNIGNRSIGTNAMHVAVRRGPVDYLKFED